MAFAAPVIVIHISYHESFPLNEVSEVGVSQETNVRSPDILRLLIKVIFPLANQVLIKIDRI